MRSTPLDLMSSELIVLLVCTSSASMLIRSCGGGLALRWFSLEVESLEVESLEERLPEP